MVQYLFNENIIVYIFAGLLGLGLLLRGIMDIVYIRLVKESDNLGGTKNKTLKHMKMKFETCYKLKIGVNNVDTFVDKNVLRYRFCGILLSTWESLSGQVLLLTFLIVPVSAVFGVLFNCGQDQILNAGGIGILSASVQIIVDKMINLPFKKQMIRLNLMDYLENFCKVRLEQETFHPDQLEEYRREYFQLADTNKQISATMVPTREEPKGELSRRREARRKKEEEKKAEALRREEEQKRIELARKEEERRKQEERRLLAAKRRQAELQKIEEDKAILEQRKAEMKKKTEEKLHQNLEKRQKAEEKNEILRSIEEEFTKKSEDERIIMAVDEIAAEKEREEALRLKNESIRKEPAKALKPKSMSPQEEKLIEDILKEFFI